MLAPEVIVVMVTAAVVGLVVVFHYEVIKLLNRWCPNYSHKRRGIKRERPAILIMMFTLLFAHVVEIWLFGLAFWWLSGFKPIGLCIFFCSDIHNSGLGRLIGNWTCAIFGWD